MFEAIGRVRRKGGLDEMVKEKENGLGDGVRRNLFGSRGLRASGGCIGC